MALATPSVIKEEHKELHRLLSKLSAIRGKVGEEARKAEEALKPHFKKEEELALPLLGLLKNLAEDKPIEDPQRAAELADKFAVEYERMLQEHAEISKTLESLEAAARRAKKRAAVTFAKNLRRHAKLEEEVLYPAALLIRKSLRR
jgi:hemerythrin-like domain-containing protein